MSSEEIGSHHPGQKFFCSNFSARIVKKELTLSAISVESVILLSSLSLKKSGTLVCLFFPRRLFKVFHIGLILNLFASISEVMYDFLEVRNKLFIRFLNLVYLILFSEVG